VSSRHLPPDATAVAAAFGVSTNTLQAARRLLRSGRPDLVQLVETGQCSLRHAVRVALGQDDGSGATRPNAKGARALQAARLPARSVGQHADASASSARGWLRRRTARAEAAE
jgi:hypothetical protein